MTDAFKKYAGALFALVALLQIGALGKIVYDRQSLLTSGREIVLPVQPVDPRDLFRGDYVILGYDITQVPLPTAIESSNLGVVRRGDAVYVTLMPAADGSWTVSGLATEYPAHATASSTVLKGRVTYAPPLEVRSSATAAQKISVRYGIESYFVPEGTGRKLEADVREKKIQAIVAVGSDGTAAIKGLVIDGERHVDPPLL